METVVTVWPFSFTEVRTMKALVYGDDLRSKAAQRLLKRLTKKGRLCLPFRSGDSADGCEDRLREIGKKLGLEINCCHPFTQRLAFLSLGTPRWWHFHQLGFKVVFVSSDEEFLTELQHLVGDYKPLSQPQNRPRESRVLTVA